MKQLITVFSICFIGEIISMVLPIPFPGSVIAMVILFLCLILRAVKPESVKGISEFFLKNMTFVFIPATVSIIEYLDVLKNVFWRFLAICLISTVICFLCTAYSVKGVMYLIKKHEEKKGMKEND